MRPSLRVENYVTTEKQSALFLGTQVQVDLAMALVAELLAAPFTSTADFDVQVFAADFVERWRQGAKAGAPPAAPHSTTEIKEQSVGSVVARLRPRSRALAPLPASGPPPPPPGPPRPPP